MDISTGSTINPVATYNYINQFVLNRGFLIIFVIVIIMFSSLGGSNNTSTLSTSSTESGKGITGILMTIIITIVLLLLVLNLFEYFYSINVFASIQDLFTGHPIINIDINQDIGSSLLTQPIPEIKYEKQVYNISENTYSYNDAKAVCTAYGSRLANYTEVEDAYNKGAEWCSYGWSEDQMVLYPTQPSTYDKLQCIPGHEHDCGRPGINGGYIANPKVKFGVNCYGYKPEIDSEEAEMMRNTLPFPKTNKEIAFEKRVDYWKTKLSDIIVAPFNKNTWSEPLL